MTPFTVRLIMSSMNMEMCMKKNWLVPTANLSETSRKPPGAVSGGRKEVGLLGTSIKARTVRLCYKFFSLKINIRIPLIFHMWF